jgi:O-antigen ligase
MTSLAESINDVATAIQLALAPVFLLTGIAGMLNVMAGRLSRIIDRGRALTAIGSGVVPSEQDSVNLELKSLERRRHLASVAITACTIAALLVCMVISALFLEVMLDAPLKWLIGALFTAATLALVVGLAFFLREVHMATRTIRIPIRGRDPTRRTHLPRDEA